MFRTTAFAFALILSTAAFAAEEQKLTVRQVFLIANASNMVNFCRNKVIRDGAKETFVCEPLPDDKFKPGLVWQISGIQASANAVAQRYFRDKNKLMLGLARKPTGELTDEATTILESRDAELQDQPADVVLPRLKRSELEPLNLQPSILAALRPIIDE